MFEKVPDEICYKIFKCCTLLDQIHGKMTCKHLNRILGVSTALYHSEIVHVISYVRLLNEHFEQGTEAYCVQHVVFRNGKFKIKITFDVKSFYKLKLSYTKHDYNAVNESVYSVFYFRTLEVLVEFMKHRVLNCNMYLNTLLFTQKYNYVKIY